MNTMTIVIYLLMLQGLLGALDTVFHHELRVALPQQHNSSLELRIHGVRAMLYSIVFAGLAWFEWGGLWLLVLVAIVGVEVVLTLWDFLVEDRTRLLPGSERVLHTLLAINGGALFGILSLQFPAWWSLPNALIFNTYGWPSWVLSLFAAGVFVSGVRDTWASRTVACRINNIRHFNFGAAPQNILITGATGFIGQELTRALLAEGHTVVALVRNPLKAAYLFQGRVRCVTSLDELHSLSRIDVVINLAGERILGPRWTARRKQQLLASRVDTTTALVAWLKQAQQKPRLMISASAVGYYGIQALGDASTLQEDSPSQPIFVSELCQRWEAAAHEATCYQIPVAILRFGLVLGHQGALPAMRLPFLLGFGGPVGDGRQIVSWVHIDDLLGAIAYLMAQADGRRVAGTYNLTAPQSVTQNRFAQQLGQSCHRPSFMRMPAALFRGVLGAQATLMLDGQRVAPVRLSDLGYQFRFPDIASALDNLNRRCA